MADLTFDQKIAEFKSNAASCGLSPTRGPQMDAYVANMINSNGTSTYDNVTPVMSAKEAACMKIPGSVDDPSTAAARWINGLKKDFVAAREAVGRSLEDIKNSPDLVTQGRQMYQDAQTAKIERAISSGPGQTR